MRDSARPDRARSAGGAAHGAIIACAERRAERDALIARWRADARRRRKRRQHQRLEREQLGARRMQIGHHDRRHARRPARRDDAGLGILEHDAIAGRDAEPRGGGKEDVGRGLAVRDLVAADERREAMRAGRPRSSLARARSRRVDVATARGMPRASSQSRSSTSPGLTAMPSAGDDRVVGGRATRCISCVDRIVGAVPLADQRDAIARSCGRSSARHQRRGRTRRRARAPRSPSAQRRAARCRASGRPCRRCTGARRRSARASKDAAAAHAVAAAAQAADARAAVRVADRAGERVGRVGGGRAPAARAGACTISCTCSFAALPWPTTACLTCSAVYSLTGKPASTAAEIAAPRAWPSSSVDCGLTLTKTFSTATSVGRCAPITLARSRRMTLEAIGQARRAVLRMQPLAT